MSIPEQDNTTAHDADAPGPVRAAAIDRFLAAVRFLTILPVPGTRGTTEDDLAGSVPWFPVVGLLLGATASLVAWGVSGIAPPMVTAVILVILLASFSGCLHLDGLSDSADGLLSSRPRERMLEIMKDSHVGPMGVIALVSVLLLKFAALASISPSALWRIAFLMPLAGRVVLVVHIAMLPYARSSGLGGVFYRRDRGHRRAALGACVLLTVACWGLLGSSWPGAWIGCLVAIYLTAWYAGHKLGGVTGDTLGAACEIVETVPAVVLAIWPLSPSEVAS